MLVAVRYCLDFPMRDTVRLRMRVPVQKPWPQQPLRQSFPRGILQSLSESQPTSHTHTLSTHSLWCPHLLPHPSPCPSTSSDSAPTTDIDSTSLDEDRLVATGSWAGGWATRGKAAIRVRRAWRLLLGRGLGVSRFTSTTEHALPVKGISHSQPPIEHLPCPEHCSRHSWKATEHPFPPCKGMHRHVLLIHKPLPLQLLGQAL